MWSNGIRNKQHFNNRVSFVVELYTALNVTCMLALIAIVICNNIPQQNNALIEQNYVSILSP